MHVYVDAGTVDAMVSIHPSVQKGMYAKHVNCEQGQGPLGPSQPKRHAVRNQKSSGP